MKIEININVSDRLVSFVKRIFTARNAIFAGAAILFGIGTLLFSTQVSKTYNFNKGDIISASQVNKNFDDLFSKVNEHDVIIAGLNPGFGVWDNTKVINNIYQAPAAGFVIGIINTSSNTCGGYIYGFTDGSPSPTTLRASASANSQTNLDWPTLSTSFTMPVRKGDYYKVSSATVHGDAPIVTIYWIPLSL